MVRKKMEGDEAQRRAAARDAERAGERPSARRATTGASKQREHVPHRNSLTHETKTEPLHRGKQRRAAEDRAEERDTPPPQPPPGRSFTGRGKPGYGEEHQRVYQALAEAERRRGGSAVHADEVAHLAGLPESEVRPLLHDLVSAHRLATEIQGGDRPDLGPRYETKPGR